MAKSVKAGGAWIIPFWGHSFTGLSRLETRNQQTQEVPVLEGALAGRFYDVAVEPKGVFWLATSEGLVRHTPLLWRVPKEIAAVNAPVYAMLQDPSDRLWFASASALLGFENGRWRIFPYPDKTELNLQPTDALYRLPGNRIAFNTANDFLLFHPNAPAGEPPFQPVYHPQGLATKIIGQFPDGSLCIQVRHTNTTVSDLNYHLAIYDGRRFRPFHFPKANWKKLGHELYFCHATSPKDFWLGGSAGIGLYRDGRLQTFSPADGAAPESASCFSGTGRGQSVVRRAGQNL